MIGLKNYVAISTENYLCKIENFQKTLLLCLNSLDFIEKFQINLP